MNENFSESVKSALEAAQQQAVMNYHQELTTAHVVAALCGSDGFFKFLLQTLHVNEDAFTAEAKALVQKIPGRPCCQGFFGIIYRGTEPRWPPGRRPARRASCCCRIQGPPPCH